MSDADCTPGREPRSVAASYKLNDQNTQGYCSASLDPAGRLCTCGSLPHDDVYYGTGCYLILYDLSVRV